MEKFSIVIPAYNEANNLRKLLLILSRFKIEELEGVYVVNSGTDETSEVVREFIKTNPRIFLIEEPKRNGKASAINLALKHIKERIVVIHSADCFTDELSLSKLVDSIKGDIGASMLECEPIMKKGNFVEKLSCYSWFLSNKTSEELQKRGLLHHLGNDIFAFRKDLCSEIPSHIVNDDAYIAVLLKKKGFKIKYLKGAKARLKVTGNILEFIKQRERINYGHRLNKKLLGEGSTTLKSMFFKNPLLALKVIMRFTIDYFPESVVYLISLILLELLSDFRVMILGHRNNYINWDIAYSTKEILIFEGNHLINHGSSRMEKQ